MEKTTMLNTIFAICLIVILTGCGGGVTGTNTAIDVSHKGGPDCTQSGCHPGFGAAGTVFTDSSGSSAAEAITVKAKSVETGTIVTLGITDKSGNFHYDKELTGYYNMAVGGKPWSNPHILSDWKGCNRCHKWPGAGGAPGRLSTM